MVTAISHARKLGNPQAVKAAQDKLSAWAQEKRINPQTDPDLLDALSESVVVQSDVDGSIVDTFDDEAKAKAWLDAGQDCLRAGRKQEMFSNTQRTQLLRRTLSKSLLGIERVR